MDTTTTVQTTTTMGTPAHTLLMLLLIPNQTLPQDIILPYSAFHIPKQRHGQIIHNYIPMQHHHLRIDTRHTIQWRECHKLIRLKSSLIQVHPRLTTLLERIEDEQSSQDVARVARPRATSSQSNSLAEARAH